MVYNISKGVVHRNQRFLDDMLHGKRTLTWPARHPSVLAYKIREALNAVQKYPEFTPYHPLKDWYRLHLRTGWVEAEYIGPLFNQEVHAPEGLTLEGARTVEEVVGACIKFSVSADELHFPKAVLSIKDKTALFRWGKQGEPPWMLINHDEVGLTMTRKRGVEEAFFWEPEDE